MAKKKRGRKTKLTKTVLKRIQEHQGEGLLDRDLARVAGVLPDTFSDWRKKASTAKSGIFFQLAQALCDEDAALDKKIINPWMKKVDAGDMKAIETAIKRHPRLRSEFKEEPAELEHGGSITFVVPKEIKDLFE